MTTLSHLSRFFLMLVLAAGLVACDSGDPGDGDNGGNNADTAPPVLLSASYSGTMVTARFNENLDPASVTAAAFTIAPSIAITSATASGSQVTITTASEFDDDQAYMLTASGIRDTAGNAASTASTSITGGGGGGNSNASQDIGAAYPNAADSRIVLFNTDGDRFLLFNPSNGSASDADDLNDVENGNIPLESVGAAVSFEAENETYFFSTDGDTFSDYERDDATFDPAASFEAEFDDFGYELESIGAAANGTQFASNSAIIFNGNGTQWQLWQPGAGGNGNDAFSSVQSFPAGFGGGGAPISAVGAAFYRDGFNELYLFNREGTQYTIWRGGNNFTAAFDISELGDFEF